MIRIADFTDADRWIVETALKERYGRIVRVEPADSDFDDLAECISVTLRLQADHEKDRAGATSGKTGAELQ